MCKEKEAFEKATTLINFPDFRYSIWQLEMPDRVLKVGKAFLSDVRLFKEPLKNSFTEQLFA